MSQNLKRLRGQECGRRCGKQPSPVDLEASALPGERLRLSVITSNIPIINNDNSSVSNTGKLP